MMKQVHGGGLDCAIARYGGARSDWLDLSTGINPNAYLVPEIPADVWHRLPDEGLLADCLAAARDYYGVPDNAAIVAAPGTQALIQLMPEIVGGDAVSILTPTYNEHAHVWRGADAEVDEITALSSCQQANVVVVNPNNPDGRVHDVAALIALARALEKRAGYLIVDEAFCDVSPAHSIVPKLPANAIVLKSFGKFFGLAGVRLGFAIGGQDVTTRIETRLGPWAVSGPALHLGTIALRDSAWIDATRARLNRRRQCVETMLIVHGLTIVGATDLFVTVSHPDSESIANVLAQNHILVRTFDYAPTWIRFGLPAGEAAFQRLERAVDHATKGK